MSSIQAEIEAIDAQIADLRSQKIALKALPVEPLDNILNWTMRAVMSDGSQTSWQTYGIKQGEYWVIVDTRSGNRFIGIQAQSYTWQAIVKYMKPEVYLTRVSGREDIESVEISGPYVASSWVPSA